MFYLRFIRNPSLVRANNQIRKHNVAATVTQVSDSNNTNEVKNIHEEDIKYPPIQSLDYRAKQQRKHESFADYVKRQETVEEKLIAINMPRYYGFTSVLIKEDVVPYNSMEQAQNITRTHISQTSDLPEFYNNIIGEEQLNEIVGNVRNEIQDVILLESSKRSRKDQLPQEVTSDEEKLQNVVTKSITRQINRILLIELSKNYPHLLEAQVDFDPRLEAFWNVGGITPPSNVKRMRRRLTWQQPYLNDPIDRHFQYIGEPNIHLRHAHPLREIIPYEECTKEEYSVPSFEHDPRTVGYFHTMRHGTNIPGFWPGDQNQFGLLSYHTCGYMTKRNTRFNDEECALQTQAVRASFAWLHGQACYQGFSTFNDITYPLVTQTIITNGKWWLFSVYQLNTMLLSAHHMHENPKKNLCWFTKPVRLYENIEDNQILGFNDDVLKNLIKLYVNKPHEREERMDPYLGKYVKYVADIQDEQKRKWLERTFKNLMSCRKRHRLMPEIYNWQEIYIRRFKTRPMEHKHEAWQRGENVHLRKLDDHTPKYIPKAHRPYPKSKAKWEKTHYPV